MVIVEGNGFSGWHALNDTIMGGRSQGTTRVDSQGLTLDAEVVETGGGFVSVRSPLFSPPLDLSAYGGLQLDLVGDGRRYKLAVACADGVAGLTELIPGGLRWVAEFGTEPDGLTRVGVRFTDLTASIRAKPVNALPMGLPLHFDASRINRLQILHSKFGDDGGLNPGFRSGLLQIQLRAIHAIL
ncbi:MAG: CIA30 family protein [Cyanobacteriota bacterium]|jgi:hypothetical protein